MRYYLFIVIAYLLTPSYECSAQAGSLDSSFGVNGIVENEGQSFISVLPDGKIICGGQGLLYRYNIDGTLDSTFSDDGYCSILFGSRVAVMINGKMIMSGQYQSDPLFRLARYKSNGIIDSTFGTNGQVWTDFPYYGVPYALAIHQNGKIIQVGQIMISPMQGGIGVVNYNSNGSLNTSFGDNGIVVTEFSEGFGTGMSVAVQPDSKIVVGGNIYSPNQTRFALVRYNSDGSLDSTFSGDGKVTTILVGGIRNDARDMALQPDGKIILAGEVSDTIAGSKLYFCRYNTDGTLDNSFGNLGIASAALTGTGSAVINSVVLQPDGKIILVGYRWLPGENYKLFIARFNSNGFINSSFGFSGFVDTLLSAHICWGLCSKLQSDGKLLVGYSYFQSVDGGMLRLLTDLNLGVLNLDVKEIPILIYPNPISSEAVLEYTLVKNETISIVLFDVQGRLVHSFINDERQITGEHKQTLQFDKNLLAGNYLLRISNGTSHQAVKIIKE